jgi:hypothetical protein
MAIDRTVASSVTDIETPGSAEHRRVLSDIPPRDYDRSAETSPKKEDLSGRHASRLIFRRDAQLSQVSRKATLAGGKTSFACIRGVQSHVHWQLELPVAPA